MLKPYLYSAILLLLAVACHIAWVRSAPGIGLVRPNFRRQPILASYGTALYGWIAALAGAAALSGFAEWSTVRLYLAVCGVMWLLGLADDVLGTREVGGFRGHFRKLIRERKLTTGAVKAIGGGLTGIAAGYLISGGNWLWWACSALLIPAAANTVNLFDLRPGRAAAVFMLLFAVSCIATDVCSDAPWFYGLTAAVTLAFAAWDSRGRAMMGDAGSNMLGAFVGVMLARSGCIALQVGAIIIFAAIAVYSEKYSLNKLIETNRVLGSIDRRLGVR